MTPLPAFCLTGASGFVGQRLLARLASLDAADVSILVRRAGRVTLPSSSWRIVEADIASAIPAGAIPRNCTVIHLASATGSAHPCEMQRVNVGGTRNVIAAAQRANVRLFLHVSSIAAGYRDKRWAPYATSKAVAEQSVTTSGLPYTLVRPTMVFGPGSPNQKGLQQLATLALPLLPGDGHVRVQPIHVDDLVDALLHLATRSPVGPSPVAIGGPAQLTMRALFAAIRRAHGLAPRAPMRVPLAPVRLALTLLAGLTGARFPVSAGQFIAFANDSIAEAAPPGVELPVPRISLERMLQPGANA